MIKILTRLEVDWGTAHIHFEVEDTGPADRPDRIVGSIDPTNERRRQKFNLKY